MKTARTPTSTGRLLHEGADLRKRMLQLFDTPFSFQIFDESVGLKPDVDISESGDEILVRAELPGLKAEDVEISLENGVLTLRGEKKEEHEEKESQRYLYECSYGSFHRTFAIPAAVNEDAVKADFSDGVLRIIMPKAVKSNGRKIQINQ